MRFSPQQGINLISTDPLISMHSISLLQFPRILLSLLPPLSAFYVVYCRVQLWLDDQEARSVTTQKGKGVSRRSCLYLKAVADETCCFCCLVKGVIGNLLKATVRGHSS